MVKNHNENIAQYTTVKIGGKADNLYIPENENELIELVAELEHNHHKYLIISGGSNLLINDKKTFENVILMKSVNTDIIPLGDGMFFCGASVRIQKFIQYAKKEGYGGIEFLYSLPAMMGGIVCMNAGRGKESNISIADFIVEVQCIIDGKKVSFSRDACDFSYRKSVFQFNNGIITGVLVKLNPQKEDYTQAKIQERLELCKRVQDHSGSTFGSVFSNFNPVIMKICQRLPFQKGIRWSPVRGNWFINDGTGTFSDAKKLIDFCVFLHHITGKKIETEVKIWE